MESQGKQTKISFKKYIADFSYSKPKCIKKMLNKAYLENGHSVGRSPSVQQIVFSSRYKPFAGIGKLE